MAQDHFSMEPFVTDGYTESRPAAPARSRMQRKNKRQREDGMLVQTVICIAALLLFIGLELFVFKKAEAAEPVNASPREQTQGTESGSGEDEETLGRLQFVNGRVYSVFPKSPRWALPLKSDSVESLEEERLLKLTAEPGESIRVSAAGQVRKVGEDPNYGSFVLVSHGNELESVYYHLDGICVDEGQPLRADDTLGSVGADGYLYVAVLEEGTLQRVFQYYTAPAGT